MNVDVSSHAGVECKLRNAKNRYPIVAYSTDREHSSGGKIGALHGKLLAILMLFVLRFLVPEEDKSWKLGVMMLLHPDLIAICDVSYNHDNALFVTDSVSTYDIRKDLSVRYLKRIGTDTCADDGLISCGIYGPDKLRSHQIPPSVLVRVRQDSDGLRPLVSVQDLVVGTPKAHKKPIVGPDGRKMKKFRCLRPHKVINARKRPRLEGRYYLFPHVDTPSNEGAERLFAMVPEDRFDDVLQVISPSCSVLEYQETLNGFDNVSLVCIDVGEHGVTGMCDPDKDDDEVDPEYSEPECRTGFSYMTWLPVYNKDGREPQLRELDDLVNVEAVLDVFCSTHGGCFNAKRNVADSTGLNVYMSTSCYVSVGSFVGLPL